MKHADEEISPDEEARLDQMLASTVEEEESFFSCVADFLRDVWLKFRVAFWVVLACVIGAWFCCGSFDGW